jgi:hypothetical protein
MASFMFFLIYANYSTLSFGCWGPNCGLMDSSVDFTRNKKQTAPTSLVSAA